MNFHMLLKKGKWPQLPEKKPKRDSDAAETVDEEYIQIEKENVDVGEFLNIRKMYRAEVDK